MRRGLFSFRSLITLQLKLPFASISAVHKERALLGLMATAMEITADGQKLHFRTFAGSAKRDEAFALIDYLTRNHFDNEPPQGRCY